MMLPKPTTSRDAQYLSWIRTLPCCMCGKNSPSEAHHSKTGGTGIKASDYTAIPLCREHHQEWHDKWGKGGPIPEELLERLLESLQHNYLTTVKGA